MTDYQKIEKAANIINKSKNIVVFTGAGISTESGIADFRSEDGLWSKYDPSVYATYTSFLRRPELFWEMHRELEIILEKAKPNPAHKAIAKLEKMGKVRAIITQNIDTLHEQAGSGKYGAKIYHLHGTSGVLHCVSCHKELSNDAIDTNSVEFPVCECGGFIKPKVVLFGEPLPANTLDTAMMACRDCDCLIMVGSSLVVSPANFMPSFAKNNGAQAIFINKDSTAMDHIADVFLKGKAGEIFNKLIEKITR
ncbi:MAG: NAD-dependent protein deacylase [Candidatus Lokiarchaeota archaeon]|nr:NAD-dependent protein deacylase [Candidatus Lokiarchaeota archaeon]MBD3341001.1 NAD-dependent protein deacylase [Candidatus Lokiarchaeota archaeon]